MAFKRVEKGNESIVGETVFIGIGSNLGPKEENIRRALDLMAGESGVSLIGVAPLYKTSPVGYQDQDWFLNTVAEIETVLPPRDLLAALLRIESGMGRRRAVRWGPRVIDLDILLYGDEVIKTPELEIPHPRLEERAFVVVPLSRLHPDMILPGGRTAADLAALLSGSQHVERYTSLQGD